MDKSAFKLFTEDLDVEKKATFKSGWSPIVIEGKEPVPTYSSKTTRANIKPLTDLSEELKDTQKAAVKSGWTPIVIPAEVKKPSIFTSKVSHPSVKPLTEIFKTELKPFERKEPLFERIVLPPILEFKKSAEEERYELVQSFTQQIKEQEKNRVDEPVEEIIESVAEEVTIDVLVVEEPAKEKTLIDRASEFITKELKTEENSFQQPEVTPTAQNFKEVTRKLKFLEEWISKVSLAGPGGGAGDIINLDHQTKLINDDYTMSYRDYYIGVNAAKAITINLLSVMGRHGRVEVIKDESGNCSNNPITVTGIVDNDTGGFILQQNNGAIQMIYRDGWRII
jgi:hypothetical protein